MKSHVCGVPEHRRHLRPGSQVQNQVVRKTFSFTPLHFSHKNLPRRPISEADGQDRILALLVPGNERCHMVLWDVKALTEEDTKPRML